MDEDRRGPEAWTAVHGPANGDTTPPDTAGPSVEALRFLDGSSVGLVVR